MPAGLEGTREALRQHAAREVPGRAVEPERAADPRSAGPARRVRGGDLMARRDTVLELNDVLESKHVFDRVLMDPNVERRGASA